MHMSLNVILVYNFKNSFHKNILFFFIEGIIVFPVLGVRVHNECNKILHFLEYSVLDYC